MTTPDLTTDDPTQWGLSPRAIAILAKEPAVLASLSRDRRLPPLPPGYVPQVIDVLFDDVPYIRSINGTLIYVRDCDQDYQPRWIEYRFDDEIAVFQIGEEYVVNRIEGIAQTAALQKLLH